MLKDYLSSLRYMKAWQYKAIGDAIATEYPILLDKDLSWVSIGYSL